MLFAETDKICLCSNVAKWTEAMYTMPQALTWLLSNQATPNIYFRASAFAFGDGTTQGNCASANAIILDIDYGSDGHKKPSPFKTLDDAAGHLLTMPLTPALAWHTGHGIQCAYLLDKPCVFPAAGGADDAMVRYMDAGNKLKAMAIADAFTPEHPYRVPLTLNSKGSSHGSADVWGSVLWYEPSRRHSINQILDLGKDYDIADILKAESEPMPEPEQAKSRGGYESIPEYIREEIESCGGERSDRLFSVIGSLVRLGYDDDFILDAVSRGHDFREKYGKSSGGLRHQVEICIAKIRGGHYVYGGTACAPIRVYNEPMPVPLNECQELSQAMAHMYRRYVEVAGIDLKQRVSDALKFHEHAATTNKQCVIESPCGAGKSVWALCHIACASNRHVYVTETVDALHKAAETLERLGVVAVGRVHGFNDDYCHKLSKQNYTWKQCIRGDTKSKCNACKASAKCAYYTREDQERHQQLCMTHSGFIRALEEGSELLADAHVVIDEGLSPFDSFKSEVKDLRYMAEALEIDEALLAQLFPQTSLGDWKQLGTFHRLDIAEDADTYGRRNYCYRNENQTQEVADVVASLRAAIAIPGTGTSSSGSISTRASNKDKAKETLAALINFFRPSAQGDATYAYRESLGEKGWRITCKRSRFSFDSGGNWGRLTMLNASASLSPFPYPDNMPVLTCADIKGNSGLVSLHLVRANPTQTKLEKAIALGKEAMFLGERIRLHSKVLICVNKDSEVTPTVEAQVRDLLYNKNPEIKVLARGRIRGVNSAGDCTLALLQGMSLFTGLDDCALHAALNYRRTFPDTPYVYTDAGSPNWPGGRMLVPAMRNYYALRSLDEIYQAIWRTAVRNDKAVEAVIVVPDAYWLAALYRTVMPEAVIVAVYKAEDDTMDVPQPDGTVTESASDIAFDEQLYGMGVCAMAPGTEITKAELAKALGYKGDDPKKVTKPKGAWQKNKASIMALIGDFFEEVDMLKLRRKS